MQKIVEQSKKTAITRQNILDAAEAEFAKNGLAAARVDAIARRAGVNKQMIYIHYQSKENLYSVVLQTVYRRLSQYEDILANSSFTGIDTIRKIILEYFEFLLNNPSFVRLVLWENLNNADYAGNVHTTLFSGAKKLLCEGVNRGVFRGDLDIEQTVISLNLFCFSAFSNIKTVSKLMRRDIGTREELLKRAEHIADVLIKYILYRED